MKTIEDITLLYEISKALNEHLDLKKSLYSVLDILSSSMNMVRGTVTILHPLRDEIIIEVAHGLSRTAMERGKYKLGEGITGRVIQAGKAVAIPKISEEPLFLDRTASRKSRLEQELSFICVPVKRGNQVIGAFSVDKPYNESYSLKEGKKLMSVKGVGPETADSILLYAGCRPVFVVDAYTRRILSRHGLCENGCDYDQMQTLFMENLTADTRMFNEYHALLVRVGKEHCTPQPDCSECPLQGL